LKVLILEEFQCILILHTWNLFLLFIWYYYVLLLSSHVDLIETMLLVYKLITNSPFSWNSFIIFNMIPTKIYYNMNNSKLTMLRLDTTLHFIFQINYNCDNSNYPPNCAFTFWLKLKLSYWFKKLTIYIYIYSNGTLNIWNSWKNSTCKMGVHLKNLERMSHWFPPISHYV
jgi:hypothetical protein